MKISPFKQHKLGYETQALLAVQPAKLTAEGWVL